MPHISHMGKNDFESRAGYRQGSVGSIELGDGGEITHRPGPFALENAKLEQYDFLCVISFKQTFQHCFRKSKHLLIK